MNVTIVLFSRELQAVISLPQLRCALYQAATSLLSATASPWLSPTVYRCSSCAQVPLADTLGPGPVQRRGAIGPELAVETGSQSLIDFLPSRLIGKHKTLTSPVSFSIASVPQLVDAS